MTEVHLISEGFLTQILTYNISIIPLLLLVLWYQLKIRSQQITFSVHLVHVCITVLMQVNICIQYLHLQ